MKTACEELAHYLEGHYRADVNLIEGKSYASQAKRLRAEGRELKRRDKLILAWHAKLKASIHVRGYVAEIAEEIEREAARIQKARKK